MTEGAKTVLIAGAAMWFVSGLIWAFRPNWARELRLGRASSRTSDGFMKTVGLLGCVAAVLLAYFVLTSG